MCTSLKLLPPIADYGPIEAMGSGIYVLWLGFRVPRRRLNVYINEVRTQFPLWTRILCVALITKIIVRLLFLTYEVHCSRRAITVIIIRIPQVVYEKHVKTLPAVDLLSVFQGGFCLVAGNCC